MSRMDFISLAGLRPDGRRPMEIRRMRCKLGVLQAADGSAYIEMGQTKVMQNLHCKAHALFAPSAITG
jgi:exosome complex component RRP41